MNSELFFSRELFFRRPLVIPSLFLCAGIAIGRYAYCPALFLGGIFALFFLYVFYRNGCFFHFALLLFGAYIAGRALAMTSDYTPLSGKTVDITGYIVSQPQYDIRSVLFDIKPYNLKTGQKIRMSVYRDSSRPLPDLKYGDIVKMKAKVKMPRGRTNPYGFDYSLYLKKSGVYAVASMNAENCKVIGKRDMGFLSITMRAKDRLKGIIYAFLDRPYSDLLSSMLLGYNLEDKNIIEDFSTTGVMHILAISGFNVGIILGAIFFITAFMKDMYLKNIIACISLLFYLFLVGFSPSILRAVIMAIIFLTAQLFNRQPDSLNSLSAAAIVILLINPLDLFDIGFQLSFVSTAFLILLYPTIYNKCMDLFPVSPSFNSLLAMTTSAQLGVLPFILYYFHRISIVSILTNVIVVPFAGLLIPLGFLLVAVAFVPMLSTVMAMPLVGIIHYILKVTAFLSHWPYAGLILPFPGFICMAIYYLFLFKFADIIDFDKKYVIACVILIAMTFVYRFYMPGPLTVSFIDVGQGDSILIVTPHKHAFLIDGGRFDERTGFDAGKSIVEPYLLMSGISSLDAVIVTHPDSDHMGGLLSIIKDMRVERVMVPQIHDDNLFKNFFTVLRDKAIPVKILYRGEKMYIDGITFEVINPSKNTSFDSDNDNSLVLRLLYKKASMLFTGDMGFNAERELIANGIELKSDILKVSHHGSATATSKEFIEAVKPIISVISVGENNYGHPSGIVLKTLQHTRIFRTDMNGAVILKTDGKKYYIKPFLTH